MWVQVFQQREMIAKKEISYTLCKHTYKHIEFVEVRNTPIGKLAVRNMNEETQ